MEEQIPLGFIGILLVVFAFAFLIGVGVIYLKQRRIQRLKNPRKEKTIIGSIIDGFGRLFFAPAC